MNDFELLYSSNPKMLLQHQTLQRHMETAGFVRRKILQVLQLQKSRTG